MSDFLNKLKNRRSYREFDSESFDVNLIINAIEAAKHSPSGANKQPWTFCVVKDMDIKRQIREKSENVEKQFYQKISSKWKSDLEHLEVDTKKPFLEQAPYLIVIFKHIYQIDDLGNKTNVYYPDISIGIATGMLISALTDLGIDILTYTPQPNDFLSKILERPKNEKPYLILVCGKGSKDYKLPKINKKTDDEIIKIY
ncbi:nitroreductase family protein [Candidatus Izemoplasma sp. B36]|uniref:nitroreductase family protein n=1 Tax=Candidatus Izemoplasma sp. B36 TaxID=3242468 RepID=UPI0035561EEF